MKFFRVNCDRFGDEQLVCATHQSKHKQLAGRDRAKTYTLELASLRPSQTRVELIQLVLLLVNPGKSLYMIFRKRSLTSLNQIQLQYKRTDREFAVLLPVISATDAAATPPHCQ